MRHHEDTKRIKSQALATDSTQVGLPRSYFTGSVSKTHKSVPDTFVFLSLNSPCVFRAPLLSVFITRIVFYHPHSLAPISATLPTLVFKLAPKHRTPPQTEVHSSTQVSPQTSHSCSPKHCTKVHSSASSSHLLHSLDPHSASANYLPKTNSSIPSTSPKPPGVLSNYYFEARVNGNFGRSLENQRHLQFE